ncbi:MAG: YsnF/AvaK domain-containing protein [Friedmanniella sp.]
MSTSDGKVGSIGQIYLDDATGEPSWITVKTGLFGTSESFVPLQNANVQGDDVVVSYAKDKIKDAPRVDPDGSLSPEEEDRLYDYYGLGTGSAGYTDSTTGTDTGIASGYVENSADADYSDSAVGAGTGTVGRGTDTDTGTGTGRRDHAGEPGVVGHDTSGPTTDDAMTLSEERLRVGTTQREAGRARLRKYVVTENVTQTVPVSHEEVRIEREPITDANVGDAVSGADISDEEHEVVLHEEQPVVEKRVVPQERVRLDKDVHTDEETVSEEVRKERIDADGEGLR